jgi:hypothetical protein
MGYKATANPTGMLNNIKVQCAKCGANLYVNPNMAKSGGGSEWPHYGKRH